MHALINRYLELAKQHNETDFKDKQSVKIANETMREMSNIVSRLGSEELIQEFSKLLTMKEYKIELWAAHHLLERHNLSEELEKQALEVVSRYFKKDSDEDDDF